MSTAEVTCNLQLHMTRGTLAGKQVNVAVTPSPAAHCDTIKKSNKIDKMASTSVADDGKHGASHDTKHTAR